MTSRLDARKQAHSLTSTAGTTVRYTVTWLADGAPWAPLQPSIWVGGSPRSTTDFTDATEYPGVVVGNVSTHDVQVPALVGHYRLRWTLAGAVATVGNLHASTDGQDGPTRDLTVHVDGDVSLTMHLDGVVVTGGGGGGAVASVNGKTGPVVLNATDVGADPVGAAAAARTSAVTDAQTIIDTLTAADVGADPAGTATTAIVFHVGATDPHDDRAYADTLIDALADVAATGAYGDLTGRPTIPATAVDVGADPAGSASTARTDAVSDAQTIIDALTAPDVGAATQAQGALADTAVQPGALGTYGATGNIPNSLGVRPVGIDGWNTKLASATQASPAQVVVIGDSLARYGNPSWVTRWADNINRRLGSARATPATITGSEMGGAGTNPAVGLAHSVRRLTAGQTASFTAACDIVGIVYTGGGGTLTVKNGATTIGTIDTSLDTGASNLWFSAPLGFGSKNITVQASVATTDVEAAMPLADNRVIAWNAALSGTTSGTFVGDPDMAFTLIDRIQPDLVIVGTGANDSSIAADVAALLDALEPHLAAHTEVVHWVPYASGAISAAEVEAVRAMGKSRGLTQIDTGAGANRVDTVDTIHPAGSGAMLLASLASMVLDGDPLVTLATAANPGAAMSGAGVSSIDTTSSGTLGLGGGAGIAINDTNGITAVTSTTRGISLGGVFAPGSRAIDAGSIRLKNLGANPAGPSVVGDIAVVSGTLRICTAGGSPGTWTVAGTQT